jgi:hypothetical protein
MHFKLNQPSYTPGPVKFYGVPGPNGEILTDERVQAFAVIQQFGNQGPEQKKYVNAFFKGKQGFTPPQANFAQLADIGKYFDLDDTEAKAVNNGTANVRPEFIVGASAPGLDSAGQPVAGVVAYQSTTVNVSMVGSEYGKICADFQHNLNVGYQG